MTVLMLLSVFRANSKMPIKRISASQQMFERFERRKKWRRFVAISYLATYTTYLLWRCTILNEGSMTLSLLYLLAEFFGLILGCNIVLKSWSYRHRSPLPLIHGRDVDVFITTYQEPLHIIRRTIMAAKEIEYPHQTWLLDDGRRPEIKKLAEEIGVKYLSRPNNLNAKAGNLNYGLQHSSAEFVMVFDADHIALPHALNIVLGFFVDEKVAMVQTPQDYYNTTAFQYMNCKRTGALWTDQSFFYNVSEPCYDSVNNASCVGTGVIYRRKVIDEIGGIPTTTVTEDTHTSIKMNKLGHHTIYINEAIAYGIASSDLGEYYKTRRRWGHGNICAIKEEKIFSCAGLSLRQRLLHMSPMFNCLEGWQQLLLLFIPIATLVFGLSPFEISIFNVIITFCFPFVSYVMLQEIGCGFSRLWTNEIFSMIRWPIHLSISEAWFGRKLKWSSSLKNIKGKVSWRLMIPQLIVLVASIFGLVVAFSTLQKNDFKTGPLFLFFKEKFVESFGQVDPSYESVDIYSVMQSGYTADLVLVAGMWVIYNIARVIFLIKKVISDTKNSHEFFRFIAPFAVTIDEKKKIYGRILKISEEWLEYLDHSLDKQDYRVGDRKKILVHLPRKVAILEIQIEKISGKNIAGTIIWNSVQERDDLARAIYSIDWHREFINRNAYFLTPSDFLLKIFTLNSPIIQKYGKWNVLLYQGKTAVTANFINQKDLVSIITFEELKIGSILRGSKIDEFGISEIKLEITNEENLSSLVEKGLDGSIIWRYTAKESATPDSGSVARFGM